MQLPSLFLFQVAMSSSNSSRSKKNVVFLHPDLGIGGAERLVVDAGLALQSRGHSVHFLTAHHDPGHCFAETRDGTLEVTVAGDWLPRSLLGGRFHAACAYARMVYAALYLVFFSGLKPDVVIADQISVCVPFLRYNEQRPLVVPVSGNLYL